MQHSAVTRFTQDEEMTRDLARQWADQELRPIVREMDNECKLRPEVLKSLFECGFMGMVRLLMARDYLSEADCILFFRHYCCTVGNS